MIKTTKESIQQKGLKAWMDKGGRGTVCMEMGSGKTRLGLMAISKIRLYKPDAKILVVVPLTPLIDTWANEFTKWGVSKAGVQVATIQAAYKWTENKGFDLIVADEIHMMMTPEYSSLFKVQQSKYLLGLTGTPDLENLEKSILYNKYCPILFEYYDSAKDGLINNTRYVIHLYSLTDAFKVQAPMRGKQILVGELYRHTKLEQYFKEATEEMLLLGSTEHFKTAATWRYSHDAARKKVAFKYLTAVRMRREFLLSLESSRVLAIRTARKILTSVPNSKVICFSELTNKVDGLTVNGVHSKKPKDKNKEIVSEFNAGKIRFMASAYSLNLGVNLTGATHAIVESLVGSRVVFRQRRGRTSRLDPAQTSEVHVLIPKGTQTWIWFKKASQGIDTTYMTYIDHDECGF